MPELPEVEITRRGIEPVLKGATVIRCVQRVSRLRWTLPSVSQLSGLQIISVRRRAKYLLIKAVRGTLIIHLGMSGSLRTLLSDDDESISKHDHIDLILDNQYILRYRDPRKFGAWLWQEGSNLSPILQMLGPEPLEAEFNTDYLVNVLKNRRGQIKTLLLNQHLIAGIGNIYANETLYYSGINPIRQALSLSCEEVECLVFQVKRVLQRAIEAGGSTLRDFHAADGQPGCFQQNYAVYGRTGLPCLNCGHNIEQVKQGQRSSFYCVVCQQ